MLLVLVALTPAPSGSAQATEAGEPATAFVLRQVGKDKRLIWLDPECRFSVRLPTQTTALPGIDQTGKVYKDRFFGRIDKYVLQIHCVPLLALPHEVILTARAEEDVLNLHSQWEIDAQNDADLRILSRTFAETGWGRKILICMWGDDTIPTGEAAKAFASFLFRRKLVVLSLQTLEKRVASEEAQSLLEGITGSLSNDNFDWANRCTAIITSSFVKESALALECWLDPDCDKYLAYAPSAAVSVFFGMITEGVMPLKNRAMDAESLTQHMSASLSPQGVSNVIRLLMSESIGTCSVFDGRVSHAIHVRAYRPSDDRFTYRDPWGQERSFLERDNNHAGLEAQWEEECQSWSITRDEFGAVIDYVLVDAADLAFLLLLPPLLAVDKETRHDVVKILDESIQEFPPLEASNLWRMGMVLSEMDRIEMADGVFGILGHLHPDSPFTAMGGAEQARWEDQVIRARDLFGVGREKLGTTGISEDILDRIERLGRKIGLFPTAIDSNPLTQAASAREPPNALPARLPVGADAPIPLDDSAYQDSEAKIAAFEKAAGHARNGKSRPALHWLTEAIREDPLARARATSDARFDPIRNHEEFQSLVYIERHGPDSVLKAYRARSDSDAPSLVPSLSAHVEAYELNASAWSKGAVSGASRSDLEQALKYAEASWRVRPYDPWVTNTLGVVRFRNGMFEEALNALTLARRENAALPTGARYHPANDTIFLAMVYWQLGLRADARVELKVAERECGETVPKELKSFLEEARVLIKSGD